MPVTSGGFGPSSFHLFFLVVGILLWGVFGTVLVRLICTALNRIRGLYQLAEAERRREALARRFAEEDELVIAELAEEPPMNLFIAPPSPSRAVAMVFVNALVIGIAAIGIFSFKAVIQSNGVELHPAQVIGLVVCGLLTSFAIIWINRQVLMTSWTSTVVVTTSYLIGSSLLTAAVFRLVQIVASDL